MMIKDSKIDKEWIEEESIQETMAKIFKNASCHTTLVLRCNHRSIANLDNT